MRRRRARSVALVAITTALLMAGAVIDPVGSSSASTTSLPADGTFVSNQGRVYRVVGRALTSVLSWTPFGGSRPTKPISNAQVQANFARTVAERTFIRTLPDKRVYRIVGGAAVYVSTWAVFGGVQKWTDVDGRVVEFAGVAWGLHPRIENAFARSAQDGRIYSFAGGAPVYVHSWTAFGGPRPTVTIDGNAITHAGQGAWRVVRPRVPDNTGLYAISAPGEQVYEYVVVGGAPVFLPQGKNLPEAPADETRVDARAIAAAGGAFPDNLLNARPAEGTFFYASKYFNVNTLEGVGQSYWVHGGAAIPVHNDHNCPFPNPHALIDQVAVDRAGTGGIWNHLAKPPANPPAPPC